MIPGLVADGVTDNTAALQAWLDSLDPKNPEDAEPGEWDKP